MREVDKRLRANSLNYGVYNEVKVLSVRSLNYVTDKDVEYMISEENTTPELVDAGHSVGVHRLSPKHLREFSEDPFEEKAKESKVTATVVQMFPIDSKLELTLRKHQESGCMDDLMSAVANHYRSNSGPS